MESRREFVEQMCTAEMLRKFFRAEKYDTR